MGVYALKPRFRAALRGAETSLVSRGVSADAVTFAGLGSAVAIAGACVVSVQLPLLLVAVAPLAVARLACNALDGMIATTTATARPAGLVLNEMCDRLSDCTVIVAVAVRAGSPWAGLAALGLVLLSSAAGVTCAAAGGRRLYGGVMGKADRMLLLAAVVPATALTRVDAALTGWLIAVAAGAAVTLAQRSVATRRELGGAVRR
jgi:phosphatidylglycerophosphate synthase